MQTLVIAIPAVNRAVIDADAVASWNWTLSTPLDGKLELSTPLDGQSLPLRRFCFCSKLSAALAGCSAERRAAACLSAAQRLRLLKTAAAAASKSPAPPSCCGDSCPAEQSRAQDRLHAHLVVDLLHVAFYLPSKPAAGFPIFVLLARPCLPTRCSNCCTCPRV